MEELSIKFSILGFGNNKLCVLGKYLIELKQLKKLHIECNLEESHIKNILTHYYFGTNNYGVGPNYIKKVFVLDVDIQLWSEQILHELSSLEELYLNLSFNNIN